MPRMWCKSVTLCCVPSSGYVQSRARHVGGGCPKRCVRACRCAQSRPCRNDAGMGVCRGGKCNAAARHTDAGAQRRDAMDGVEAEVSEQGNEAGRGTAGGGDSHRTEDSYEAFEYETAREDARGRLYLESHDGDAVRVMNSTGADALVSYAEVIYAQLPAQSGVVKMDSALAVQALVANFRAKEYALVTGDMLGTDYAGDPNGLCNELESSLGFDVTYEFRSEDEKYIVPAVAVSCARVAVTTALLQMPPGEMMDVMGIKLRFMRRADIEQQAKGARSGMLALDDVVVDGRDVIKPYGEQGDKWEAREPALTVELRVGLDVVTNGDNAVKVSRAWVQEVINDPGAELVYLLVKERLDMFGERAYGPTAWLRLGFKRGQREMVHIPTVWRSTKVVMTDHENWETRDVVVRRC